MFDKKGTWVWVSILMSDFRRLICLETGATISVDEQNKMIMWRSHQVSERGAANQVDLTCEIRRVKIYDYKTKHDALKILKKLIKITKAKRI